jgi:flavin reductase (DIM6/NTAB) family NADH-FMN oxidoreductase RutF
LVSKAAAAFACTRELMVGLGDGPHMIIFGRVRKDYVDDRLVTLNPAKENRIQIDPTDFDPLGRLGAGFVCQLGEKLHLPKIY